ncbi:hypothetical protein PHYPSEUDO_010311 [Phytophthora pseudosyringae]|uniref:Centrosomal protein CEP104 N-terminal domain-containing protein n=1 Tax=Phytophthora pseudosyringae TaxID=221518 RepID=A0A8T1VAB8_9STRA|nr:hypothetical protein PHYPSEUDO_010311 [Phytophthora pseudosyringae]
MYSLPFRLLVVNDLDLQVAARSDRHRWQPPGAVEESEYQPLWKSKPNTPFPQELGLILLSAQPATIKAMRLAVEVARTPAKIVVFAALPPRQGCINALNALDCISRYLSVDWKQCCEPLVWEQCSSARLDTARDIDSRTLRLDALECSFVKLVVHTPHASPRNQSQEVVLEDIELLGFAEASAPTQSLHSVQEDEELMNHCSGVIHRPTLLSLTSDNDELQAVLLDAGVPMDLVAQVASLSNSEAGMLMPSQAIGDAVEVTPESNCQGAEPVAVRDNVALAPLENSSEDRDPPSPFDNILRQYVEQTSLERSTLEEILVTKICKLPDEVSSWQSPTISPSDPANSNEITLYTFGTFFTQCLLCGGADIQRTCLHMAERTAPLMKKSIGATFAFEGIVALTVLGIREAKSSQVFQAAIHLAHTAFLTDMAIAKKADILHPNLVHTRFIGIRLYARVKPPQSAKDYS